MTSLRILDSRDSILSVFATFRDEIDEHNDRRERLIKVRPSCLQPLPTLMRPDPSPAEISQVSQKRSSFFSIALSLKILATPTVMPSVVTLHLAQRAN